MIALIRLDAMERQCAVKMKNDDSVSGINGSNIAINSAEPEKESR